MTTKELTQITDIMRQVMADREEAMYQRVEGAAKHYIRQELEDDLYAEVQRVVRETVKNQISVSVEVKPNGPIGGGA